VIEAAGGSEVEAVFCVTCRPAVVAELQRVAEIFSAYRADGLSADAATRAITRWHMRRSVAA
jgi:hypothetical protein